MAPAPAADAPLRNEPAWPDLEGRRAVFLIDACSELETRVLEAWIERNRPEGASEGAVESIRIPPSRRRRPGISLSRLDACLASDPDALLAPLRVAWLPRKRGGTRAVRFRDLLRLGDPRDPGRLRQFWILRNQRDRCRVVAGDPAPVSELRERWQRATGSDPSQTTGLAEFVARQAGLALERGERRLRGNRYKVPRLVQQDILGKPSFRGGITRLAKELGRPRRDVEHDASRYLREIAATHSPFVIDLAANLIHLLYTQGYGESLHYDHGELERIKSLSQRYPVVFLPSHKSNLDHLVLQYALHQQGHPPNHTAGGINMNFFPVGPIVRRSGVFFIRRSFKDNPVYKFVLHAYIDFLIEKRFSLEWYIEGGRSRSGKLLPPRFGMLAYVVDSFRRGKAEDVMLIPTSIAYDQIQDVGDYAAEQQGRPKQKESFGWFVGVVKRLRRRYGNIHIRFGEPIALSKVVGRAEPGAEPRADENNLAIQKLAFEVATRINRVTPVTPSSLVTLALLGVGDQALTLDEIRGSLGRLVDSVRRRQLPQTDELDLSDESSVRRALDALVENGVVSRFSEGPEAIYRIGPDEQIAAAYYSNTIAHFFVTPAIAELSLLRAADDDAGDPSAAFWDSVMALRDLMKFEFFFSEKEIFRRDIATELGFVDSRWESRLEAGTDAIQQLVRSVRPFSSHRVLRPLLEAYGLVADHLGRLDPAEPVDRERCIERCMQLGRQYHLQRRIRSTASLSQLVIGSALRLAENRELLETGAPDLANRRRAFADEIRTALRRIAAIDALAASRRSGLID